MDSQQVAEIDDEGRNPGDRPVTGAAGGSVTGSGRRRLRGAAVAALVLALLAAGFWFVRQRAGTGEPVRARPEAATRVTTAAAEVADLPVYLQALGTVTPLATVTVRTRIDGQITRIAFQEGQEVRKGDFLVEIDPRPYQAALDQAEGQLARDQALLRNAEVDLVRYRGLVAEDSIARQTLDTQDSLVRQYRATVKIDQAQVETARLNLEYCRIVSPIDGRIGLRQVDIGNYVQTGDTDGIVVVTQMRPITVVFTIPEDNLQRVWTRMRAGSLPVTAYDRSGDTELATGVLTTMDNQVDTSTGTVKLKAQFENALERLFPNQFVNVRLLVETLQGVTVVPSAAVQRGTQGAYVYVVSAEGTVAARPVAIGVRSGERTQVTSGLAAGETVVTDGVDRLRDGSRVTAAPTPTPTPTPAATPAAPRSGG